MKTSAQGIKSVKLKGTVANVRFWDSEGKRTEAPAANFRSSAAPPALGDEQRGLLLELRDVKLDEGVEERQLFARKGESPRQDSLLGGPSILTHHPSDALQNSFP